MLRALATASSPGASTTASPCTCRCKALPQLRADGFEWLVPALRAGARDGAAALAAQGAAAPARAGAGRRRARCWSALKPRRGPLLDALARGPRRCAACACRPAPGRPRAAAAAPADDVPGRGRATAGCWPRARTSTALRAAVARACAPSSRAATSALERHGLRAGRSATLPRAVALPGHGQAVRAYPALVDEGDDRRRARVRDAARRRRAAMRAGTRRLLALTVPSPAAPCASGSTTARSSRWPPRRTASVARRARRRDRDAAIDALIGRAGGPGVGRGRLRAACATTSPARSWPTTARGRRAGRRASSTPCREVQRAARGAPAPRAAAGARSTSRASSAAGLRRLRRRHRRARGCPTSSATCAPPRGGWSGCRPRRRRTPTACAASTSSRRLPRLAGRGARARPLREVALDARGAAGQPLRPGPRRARPGVGEADPARTAGGSRAAPA